MLHRQQKLNGHVDGLNAALGASSRLPPAAAGSRYAPARQSEPPCRVRRRENKPFSFMGGEKPQSQVLVPHEQSCCWEEIAWGTPRWGGTAWGPLRAVVGIASLFTLPWLRFLSCLLLPFGFGQETCISMEDWLPPLLKRWQTSLHLK